MKTYDQKLADLSVKLAELSKKTATAAEDAKVGRELLKEAIREKMVDAKGAAANLEEDIRNAGEEGQGKFRTAVLKTKMTVKAGLEDLKEARDKRHLENFVDAGIIYIYDCYEAAAALIAEAELSILEVAEALKEYDERFGGEKEA